MNLPALLAGLSQRPSEMSGVKQRVRAKILRRIASPQATTALERLREAVSPSPLQISLLRGFVLDRCVPLRRRPFTWARMIPAFVVFLLLVRFTPVLFLAPRSLAVSHVILKPTVGTVEISHKSFWQKVPQEVPLTLATNLRTRNGEATLTLHAFGVVRLAPNTEVILHDTGDHPGPSSEPILTLITGKIWVQAMVPDHLQGLRIAINRGTIDVHQGSVSIRSIDDGIETVDVWDRRATADLDETSVPLVTGEHLEIFELAHAVTKRAEEATDTWATTNLERDAVRNHEIALAQMAFRAAHAGISPTSIFYPVKRLAEQVDVLFTFGHHARVEKELAHAETRLNEAAAVLAEEVAQTPQTSLLEDYRYNLRAFSSGSSLLALSGSGTTSNDVLLQSLLRDYQSAVLAVASGATLAGSGSAVALIVEEQVNKNSIELASALPDERMFLLKKAVLEASAALPSRPASETDVKAQLMMDTLAQLRTSVKEGDIADVQPTLEDLEPYFAVLKDRHSTLSPELKKEAETLLGIFATDVIVRSEEKGDVDHTLINRVTSYLPNAIKPKRRVAAMTDEQLHAMVEAMLQRIYTYSLPRSQWNQLLTEFRSIRGLPDQGRILRYLYTKLPADGLGGYVRSEIVSLRVARSRVLRAGNVHRSSSSSSVFSSEVSSATTSSCVEACSPSSSVGVQ